MLRRVIVLVVLGTLTLSAVSAEPPLVEERFVLAGAPDLSGVLLRPSGLPAPRTLVAFVILPGETIDADWLPTLRAMASRGPAGPGAVVVAVEPGGASPYASAAIADSVLRGVRHALERGIADRVVLVSVGAGAVAATMAIAEGGERAPGKPLFQDWVSVAGVADLAAQHAHAGAMGLAAVVAAIEMETGGAPSEAPEAYARRSAVSRLDELRALHGLTLAHAAADGVVPYAQSRSFATGMRDEGTPVRFTTVLRGSEPASAGTLADVLLAGHGAGSLPSAPGAGLGGHPRPGDMDAPALAAGIQDVQGIVRSGTRWNGEHTRDANPLLSSGVGFHGDGRLWCLPCA